MKSGLLSQMFCSQPPGYSGYFNPGKQTEDGNTLQVADKGSGGGALEVGRDE